MSRLALRLVSFVLFAAVLVIGPSCLETGPQQTLVADEAALEVGDRPYRHPLKNVALADGKIPARTEKNSADGYRYAVMESFSEDESGAHSFSGIAKLERRIATEEEIEKRRRMKIEANGGVEPRYDRPPLPKISRDLNRKFATMSETDTIEVWMKLPKEDKVSLMMKLEQAVASGEVYSINDYHAKRRELIDERKLVTESIEQPVAEEITRLGGEVVYKCISNPCVIAKLTPRQIEELASRPDILKMDYIENSPDAEDADIAGRLVIQGTQIKQFTDTSVGTDPPYDGEYGSGTTDDILWAFSEGRYIYDEHDGYDESNLIGHRFKGRYICDAEECDSTSNFPTPINEHATMCSGLVFGDLRDGQDSGVSDPDDRIDRSGYAGESRGYIYSTGPDGSCLSAAITSMNHMETLSPAPHVVSASWGCPNTGSDCLGTDPYSDNANDLYDDGILWITSAGNVGHNDPDDCTVKAPGSAIGVFTVGAHGNSSTGDERTDVRDGSIYTASSLGGVSEEEGNYRTIIDATGYACRTLYFDESGGYSEDDDICGTSISCPTVAGGAINFIDWWKSNISDTIDHPGNLFVMLLLQGDRQGQSGRLGAGYDNLWGAGRFKMRRYDTYGLDYPYGWTRTAFCVDHHETVTITINSGSTLSSDVEVLRSAIYWYDSRHEDGTTPDDIDLSLKTTGGGLLVSDGDAYDNKEQVKYDVGGLAVKLEVYGYNVTADDTGCGTNSMLVHLGYMYEDTDRDDGNGPCCSRTRCYNYTNCPDEGNDKWDVDPDDL